MIGLELLFYLLLVIVGEDLSISKSTLGKKLAQRDEVAYPGSHHCETQDLNQGGLACKFTQLIAKSFYLPLAQRKGKAPILQSKRKTILG